MSSGRQLPRGALGDFFGQSFGADAVRLVGVSAFRGHILAAHDWDAPPTMVPLEPARLNSYEETMHETGLSAFVLPVGGAMRARDDLVSPRIARAVGPIYRPDRELALHYHYVSLPLAFDEYVFFDEVTPIPG